ncbi:MAG: putative nucleotidyltransferase [Burkholderiaceae bacterium]|jgi:predicted nucleotidyltransferase
MRLLEKEVNIIRSVIHAIDPDGKIYLFGSRSDDLRRGGDIDLFLDASLAIPLKSQLAMQYRLASQCDTHVDLLVKTPEDEEKTIYGIARKGISL